jgi:hypothetical protein
MKALNSTAIINSVYRSIAEEEYYEDLWNEIQEENWKADICKQWICHELGEDLIIFEDEWVDEEPDYEYEEILDYYRKIDDEEWRVDFDRGA